MSNEANRYSLATILHVILLRPLLKLIFGVNIIGRDNLEHLKQYIIIANHNSHLDILLLFYLLPTGHILRTHPVADQPYFSRSRLLFTLVTFFFKPIWVTRGKPDIDNDPFAEIKNAIDNDQNVIIFPEGTRGRPGELEHFKSGIGRLMVQYPDMPIVPVFLTGPERGLPKTSGLLLPIWNNIIIGPPQNCFGTHRDITRNLENRLVELSHSESARRHKRQEHIDTSPKCIGVLGIDGSGKSTVSKHLARTLSESSRVCLISDEMRFFEEGQPTDMQPLLSEKIRRAIGSYAKKAKSLKLYKIPKLTELLLRDHLLKEASRWYRPEYIVLDGSPLLNLLAWSVLYKGDLIDNNSCARLLTVMTGGDEEISRDDPLYERFGELKHFQRLHLTNLTLPELVILINVNPSTACQRITSRGEQQQVHETKEKLGLLGNAYLRVCEVVQDNTSVPVLVADGEAALEEVCNKVIEFTTKKLEIGS